MLSKKVEEIKPSVTLSITAKANELKGKGVDLVSFGVGEPDFNTPKNVIEAAKRAMDEGKTKYTATNGVLELRKSICYKLKRDNNLDYDSTQIVVSTGAKQALANALMAILNPEDEVIIAIPYWVSYPELVKLSGGIPKFIETKEINDFKFTVEDLQLNITSKTKAIIINTPNNPTGTIYSYHELKAIAEFAKKYDLLIISDEIYEKLIYDDNRHISIASISKDAYERTIVINGFSKSYAMTGWRIGYSASSHKIAKLINSVQSHITSNVNTITQYAAIEALNGAQDDVNIMINEFSKRREFMINILSKLKDVSIIKPKGAFYIMLNVSKYYGKQYNNKIIKNSIDFATELLEKENVVVIPGVAFGLDSYVRLSYPVSIETIEKGINRISNFLDKLS